MAILWTDSLATLDWQALEALYRSAPLGNKNAKDLETAFCNSRYRCFAYEDGILVAAGRALADGVDVSYIGDVVVRPSHQGLGLGKDVVQRLMDLSVGHKKILLYAVPGKEGFYRKFGFLRMRTAMAVFENPAQAITRGHVFPD